MKKRKKKGIHPIKSVLLIVEMLINILKELDLFQIRALQFLTILKIILLTEYKKTMQPIMDIKN